MRAFSFKVSTSVRLLTRIGDALEGAGALISTASHTSAQEAGLGLRLIPIRLDVKANQLNACGGVPANLNGSTLEGSHRGARRKVCTKT
jgi:hypothetical protein